MKLLRRLLLLILLVLAVPVGWATIITYSHANINSLPMLESGDLIFQTHPSSQAPTVMLATGSLYSHVGIVRKVGDQITVIHAARIVSEIPLREFIESGWGERMTIKRYEGLTTEQRDAVVNHALTYLGRPYDFAFHMGDDAIYCSELPFLAFGLEHVVVGNPEKIGDLYVNNFLVRELFNKRWKGHPLCDKPGTTAAACWKTVMNEPIITPVNLAKDSHFKTIYDNYGF